MNLVIFGSRTLSGDVVRSIILDELAKYEVREIVVVTSGKTGGVCQCARELAQVECLPLLTFWADARRYARGMYDHRSRACLSIADRCLFVWDGKSRGTRGEIDLADKLRVPYRVRTIRDASQGEVSVDAPSEVEGWGEMLPLDSSVRLTFK